MDTLFLLSLLAKAVHKYNIYIYLETKAFLFLAERREISEILLIIFSMKLCHSFCIIELWVVKN